MPKKTSLPEAIEPEARPEPATLENLAGLDSYLAEFVGDADGGIVGLVIHDGRTVSSTVGVANAKGEPVKADTAFRVGSITKTFVATMVLQLVAEGLVDLDDPLSTYLPETSVGGDVTVRSLLAQRSGIPSYTEQPDFFRDSFEDIERSLTPDEVLAYVADVPGDEPGQAHSYSNTGYILLGQLVEAVCDSDLDTVLQARVVEPLGLEATAIDVDGSTLPDTLAGGWGGSGVLHGDATAEYESISSGAWSAGALVAKAPDLATFLAGLFDGQLVPEEFLADMLDTGSEGYGLGLASTQYLLGDVGSDDFYGHSGKIPGFKSLMAGVPETGEVVVLLSNNDAHDLKGAAAGIVRAWADL